MPVFNNALAGGSVAASGYEIERSLRFNASDSAYLSRTPSSAGNQKTFTFSTWLKLSDIGTGKQTIFSAGNNSALGQCLLEYDGTYQQLWFRSSVVGGTMSAAAYTTALFRDTSAWYHLVMSVDTTQGTEADRVKLYINGVSQPFTTYSIPLNGVCAINSASLHLIGRSVSTSSDYLNSYLADVYFIDAQALAPTDFGETDDNGVWQPKKFAGTYGTNGFHLDFKNNSSNAALGTDTSGNSNTWTVTNLSAAAGAGNDSLRDSPSQIADQTDTGVGGEVIGNYCTWNPNAGLNDTLTNGNLECSLSAGSLSKARATIGVSSGKYYWEIQFKSGGFGMIGISDASLGGTSINYAIGGLYYYVASGGLYGNVGGSFSNTSYGSALSADDILGIALDMDNGNVKFYKNGSDLGTANTSSLVGKTIMPHLGEASGATFVTVANFGQRTFAHTAPTGFKALCTANLTTPTIADGSKYFDTKLYTSTGADLSVAGLQFSPDFVWVKNRQTANRHALFDIVRGPNKYLSSTRTNAESTTSGSGYGTGTFNSFDAYGFTVGSDVGVNVTNYPSGESHVAWAWDAGSSNTTIAAGSLNSSAYDQSQTWSGLWTGTPGYGSYTSLHDSDITNYVQTLNGTLTFSSAIAVTSIRILANRYGANTTLSINGTNVTSQLAAAGTGLQWNTITGFTSVTSITVTGADYSSNVIGLYGIELSGKLLVDSGVSVTNVPSISSTVRANPSAGFSIVSYAGHDDVCTIGHGLNTEPYFAIFKNRGVAEEWVVYHKSIGNTNDLVLNSTVAANSASNWNNTTPTSSVISLGYTGQANESGSNYLAYCFAPVEGYSAMGSYVGNGSFSGPFVHTGFKVSFLMIKCTSTSNNWVIFDAARDPHNKMSQELYPDNSNAESTSGFIDFLSNGFRLNTEQYHTNQNGQTFVYLAFASYPFKTARAR